MNQNLSAISNYLTNIFSKTDDLEKLEKRVNELVIDEIIKDFTVHRTYKQIEGKYFIYDVDEEDYNHIVEYIKPIQDILLPTIVIMAQKTTEEYRIFFRLNEEKKNINIDNYFERKSK